MACTSTGTLQAGKTNRIDDAALFAEVGQRHDDAVDLVRGFLNSPRSARDFVVVSTAPYFVPPGVSAITSCPPPRGRADHFFAAGLGQMVGKKAAVADDHAKCHLLAAMISAC